MPKIRGRLFKDRTTAKQELQAIVKQAQKLKNTYQEAKPGQASLLNLWGAFGSGNIANPKRVAGIDEIQRVIELINNNLNLNNLTIDQASKANISTAILKSHVTLYQTSVAQLKGAILNQADKIYNSYIIRSPENHSDLYDALRAIVNPAKMAEDKDAIKVATKTCLDAYNLLVENNPKQNVDASSADTSSEQKQNNEVESPAL